MVARCFPMSTKYFRYFLVNTVALDSTQKQLEACNFIKKETLAQVFSCEFCEIYKNTFFTGHLRATASVYRHFSLEKF